MVNITDSPASVKEELLGLIRVRQGSYCSGEEISKRLGVSRTAIWKNIKSLRSQGYVIESHPRLGHKLIDIPDILLPIEIKARLKSKTLGQKVYHLFSTGSTQEVAFELARKGISEGAIVVAEEQSSGRGRRGRYYFCPGGGIWFSLILRPPLPPRLAPVINLAAGAALAELILQMGLKTVLLRWPNDVLIGGKKVSGILAEMSAEQDLVHFVILGMGINVNIEKDSFPEDLRAIATSLKLETGKRMDRVGMLCNILERLEHYYYGLLEKGTSFILEAWKSLPNMLGSPVKVTTPEGTCEGIAARLDEEGALILKVPSGEERRFVAGDISLAGPDKHG